MNWLYRFHKYYVRLGSREEQLFLTEKLRLHLLQKPYSFVKTA